MNFGELCKRERLVRKLDKDEVAKRAGISRRYVNDVERGNSVSWLTLEAMLGVYGYELTAVKNGKEE